jgi:hypothetical protein
MSSSDEAKFNKLINFLLDRKLNTPTASNKPDDNSVLSAYPLNNLTTSEDVIVQKKIFNSSANQFTPNLYLLRYINEYSNVLRYNMELLNFLKEQMEGSQDLHMNSRTILDSQNKLNNRLKEDIKKYQNSLHLKKLTFFQNDYKIKNTIFYYNFILNILLFLTAIFVVLKLQGIFSNEISKIIAVVLAILMSIYMLQELSLNNKRVYHNYNTIKFNKNFKNSEEI